MHVGCEMNGWAAALIIGIAASVWIEWQNGRLNELAERMHRAEAIAAGYEEQRKNTLRFDEIDEGLKNGGKDDLSDYMRGAAGELWPAP